MPADPTLARPGLATSLRDTLEMIKFSHSVFALPFALFALVLASGGWPEPRILFWVVVAMVAARSAAMSVNRLADRAIDAENPRTAGRPLVTGRVSVGFAVVFTVAAIAVFLIAAWQINTTALALAPLVLVVLFGYSFLTRFTSLAHFGVGLALGLSPLGAWVAGAGGLVGDLRIPLVLGAGVMTWVAGFDVIYACQDVEFDRSAGLFSIPARFGRRRALGIARALHASALLALAGVGLLAGLHPVYWAGWGIICGLVVWQHRLVRPDDLSRVGVAFFNINGTISVVYLLAVLTAVLLPRLL